ncbi:hypothetical protein OS493_028422 [Desmophyllum pertusum]|uniref:Uncharacterized protein n=1 Tax=Desmophyllum pertusum TaxID=174260 RepID=A0A9W9ZLX2_9CNID|nr:hypothetical protein OS493_028422 [Desmophyllum pertusum]
MKCVHLCSRFWETLLRSSHGEQVNFGQCTYLLSVYRLESLRVSSDPGKFYSIFDYLEDKAIEKIRLCSHICCENGRVLHFMVRSACRNCPSVIRPYPVPVMMVTTIATSIPFFEIGAVHYEEYLVNIRLPASKLNEKIGKSLKSTLWKFIRMEVLPSCGFTINSIVGPISIIILIWFAKRVKGLRRDPVLLEKALFALGVVTAFMNFPLEWFTLWINMPFMLLFTDIRQGLFYGMLMCFWIIFTGEHLVDQPDRNKLKSYWCQMGAIGFGCVSLLVFDMCERGYQLHNPFYTIWATKSVLEHPGKRDAIPTMSRARQLKYQGLIYRFEFLMVVTVLCAGLTVVFFIISNVNEAQWKFGDHDHEEDSTVEVSSALFTGIYGMWNIYVFSVVFLYAPSHASPATDNAEEHERLELRSRTEVRVTEGETEESVIYKFTGKTAQTHASEKDQNEDEVVTSQLQQTMLVTGSLPSMPANNDNLVSSTASAKTVKLPRSKATVALMRSLAAVQTPTAATTEERTQILKQIKELHDLKECGALSGKEFEDTKGVLLRDFR